ncbi:MAG: hypothetical protein ABUL64_00500, partial [Singulisphaera sp.]
LEHWGMTFGGQSLAMLIDSVTGIKDQMIEGPKELLRKEITGDWIVRVGTKDFQRVKQLDKILREELQLPLHLQLLEVERPVFVLSGEYRYQPLDKQFFETKWRKVDIFGKARNPNSGAGGGSGDFSDMLQWVGRWINTPVISDLASPPDDSFTWQLHLRHPDTKQTQAEDHDPQMVMANFAAQTGLKFAQETRPVRILFVKRDE